MTTWQDILSAIRDGKNLIPVNDDGIPLVGTRAALFELMELMEALTTGYNDLVVRAAEDQKRIERIRKLAEAHFPASKKNTYNWVRVGDRLPKKSGEYYTYGSMLGVCSMVYSAKYKLWNARDFMPAEDAQGTAIFGVTHWCEPPAKPIDDAPAADEED